MPPSWPIPEVTDVLDKAVRFRANKLVPAEHLTEYNTILMAFADYEAGRDEAAKTNLQAIGLNSPFAPWKLLLRGLMAYAQGDTTKALENWSRLKSDRLPYHLARPVQALFDPELQKSLPKNQLDHYQNQLDNLQRSPLKASLNKLQQELSQEGLLPHAFATAERVLSQLRVNHPDLVPSLALIFYAVIEHHGRQGDLVTFRRLFGSPPHDPDFHRLNAIRYAREDVEDQSNQYWAKYEKWLATTPPSEWSVELVQLIRAQLLVMSLADFSEQPHLAPTVAKKHFATLRKAIELAPDFEDALLALIELASMTTAVPPAELTKLVDRFLARQPTKSRVAQETYAYFDTKRDYHEALRYAEIWHKAAPLDRSISHVLHQVRMSIVRECITKKDYKTARQFLQEYNTEVAFQQVGPSYTGIEAILDLMQNKPEEAQAKLSSLDNHLAIGFIMAVESAILGLKPALKKPFDEKLKATLAQDLAQDELLGFVALFTAYSDRYPKYRGLKTQQKLLEDALLRYMVLNGDTAEFAELFLALVKMNADAFVLRLGRSFPDKLLREVPSVAIGYAETVLRQATHNRADHDRADRYLQRVVYSMPRKLSKEQEELVSRIHELLDELTPESLFFQRLSRFF